MTMENEMFDFFCKVFNDNWLESWFLKFYGLKNCQLTETLACSTRITL